MKMTLLRALGATAAALVAGGASQAAAQTLLYSFETLYNDTGQPDPLGTRPDNFTFNGGGTTVTQDTFGVTEGTRSMKFRVDFNETFNGAITALGAPFPVIDNPATTAVAVDYTVR